MPVRMYNFTEGVRASLAAAREQADRFGVPYVGTEHVLLGVLRSGASEAARVLRTVDLDPALLRQDIESRLGPNHTTPTAADMPYTSAAKRVLERAMDEARDLRDEAVGEEHLLLGLAGVEGGITGDVLRARRVRLEELRAAVAASRSVRQTRRRPWWQRFLGRPSAPPEA